jgi:PAS domain S-box-containing protein
MPNGYEILEWLGDRGGARLARGRVRSDAARDGGRHVLLKIASAAAPSAAAARLRREHELALALAHCPGVLRPVALELDGPQPALALEAEAGETLEAVMAAPIPRPRALRLALRLARAVAGLHEAQVLHRDLCPRNLWVDAAGEMWFLDLSRATRWDEPERGGGEGTVPPGDLAYISPEQTGRMNRAVDLRSDLYSLGVILYRLFAGVLPFQAADPLEWVHAHLARTPAPLADPALSAIVLRLLAKPPEDRYQSARGLALDLSRCVAEWDAHGRIAPFAPGQNDVPARFQSPQKLYGRAAELEALWASFERVARGGTELALVAGYSGVGKSSLVHELRRRIPADSASFIAGKFDPLRGDIPYATLVAAFRELVSEILAGSEEEIAAWRQRLGAALGAGGQLIVDVIPEVELVIGAQPPVAALPPAEAQNRFRVVFAAFVGAVAQEGRPLVLFVDDLQWADPASLALLRALLVDGGVRHLLVLGAYRDNEVDAAHPLSALLDDLGRAGAAVTRVQLAPLAADRLAALIADGLHCLPSECADLTEIVHGKTAGNPFFAIQFLMELCDERLVAFDARAGRFRWDVAGIRRKRLADNVADLMIARLGRLPRPARALLERLASLGHRAEVALLALACGDAEAELDGLLQVAAQAGLVVRIDGGCAFLHDRVREAAYALIPEAERPAAHLDIARRWTAGVPAAQAEEQIFELVAQWNLGLDAIADARERATVARLNLLAGRRARAAVAYASARAYLAQALALLPPDAWDAQYEDTLTLHLELAECEYMVGAHARGDALLEAALARARSPLDAARADRLRVRLYQLAGRQPDAVAVMLAALARLGLSFPETDAAIAAAVAAELEAITVALRGRGADDLVDAPEAQDPAVRAAMGILEEGLAAIYVARPAMWPLLALRTARLSLEHGHTDESAFGYIAYAVVLAALTGDHRRAFTFSELSLRLDERRGTQDRLRGKLLFHHAAMVSHWCRHLATTLGQVDEAFPACLAAGQVIYAGYLTYNRVWLLVETGAALPRVAAAARDGVAFAETWHTGLVADVLRAEAQLVACLEGKTRAPASFDDDSFREAECLEVLERAGFHVGLAFFHVAKQLAGVVYGRAAEAHESAARAALHVRAVTGLPPEAAHHFYRALALAALHDEVPGAERPAIAAALAEELGRHQRWAEHGPENFGHRRARIAAEVARIEGREGDAARGYDEAIRAAREHGFVHAEALAWEALARFQRARGLAAIADAALREARAAYARWGATGKVAALERDFPQLAPPPPAAAAPEDARRGSLDLLAAIKGSQAISRQIVLGDLLDVLMRVVLEAAGAQAAWLVLARDRKLALAARAVVDDGGVQVDHPGDAALAAELPLSILNYVRRSRERVLLADAAAPGPFAADAVLAGRGARSVLCLPVLHQAELIALLYLENRLVSDAFTRDRLAVLELLAAQAAISLENARLYAAQREGQALLQAIVDHAPPLIYVKDRDGRYLLANRALAESLATTPAAMLGKTDDELYPREAAAARRAVDARVAAGEVVEGEELGPDGARSYLFVKAPLTDGAGRIYATCGIHTEITERKRADAALRRTEEQLRQAQKMEAIGNLAGGVAHDFNNLLSVILSYGTMLAADMGPADPRRADLEEIVGAAGRAEELTQQLLAFGRRQILSPRVLDLNDILARVEKMLRRLLGEDIELTLLLAPGLGAVRVDAGQIDQIVVNLAVNARDAMPDGGKLTIETANVALDDKYAAEHLGVVPGPHVLLAVSDTGTGMDRATQARMFEPFFTTKEKGKGTGLGLATVFGIVRQSGAHIWVYSEPGAGTTFKIYFPRVEGAALEPPAPAPRAGAGGGSETILLVEDDERVRTLARTILRRLGYHVLEAQSAGDALLICEQHPATIHLLLTDVIMPRVSGRQLAERLLPIRPSMRVLYMSGYTDNSIVHHGVLDSGVAFLQKPLTPEKLARKVREALDARA